MGLGAGQVQSLIVAAVGTQVINETPSGTVNGINTAFTLANTPTAGSVQVFVVGLNAAIASVSGATITLTIAPAIAATIKVNYRY